MAIESMDDLRASTKVALTQSETAHLMHVDRRTIARAIEAGELPCIRLGRRVLIPREPLLAMLTCGAAEKSA